MGLELTVYTVPLLAATLVGAATAVIMWQHRPRAGAALLAATMGTNGLWAAGQLVTTSATTVSMAADGMAVTLVAIAATALVFGLFGLRYTGYDERLGRPAQLLLIAPVPLLVVLSITNPDGIMYVVRTTGEGARFQWEIGKWALTGYGYFTSGVGAVALSTKVARSRNVYRKRTFLILAGGVSIVLAHAVAMAGLSPTPYFTLSPLLFLAFGVLTLLALGSERFLRLVPADRLLGLFGGRFDNIAPIARDLVIEKMGSGVVVLDDDNRIVDLNPLARQMLGTGDRRIVGHRLESVVDTAAFEEEVEFIDATVRTGSFEGVWVTDPTGERHCYDIVITDLAERRDDVSGRVAIIHDVTDQQARKQQLKRRTAQLERQNDRLEEFASVVSHDLRNPLNVAQGRLELAEEEESLAELDGVRDAHERMEAIIDEMLALAREGQTVDETTAVDLASMARDAWETTDTAGATLSVDIDGLQVQADEGRLRRAFENLYRNAVEHGRSDGLTVRVGPLDESRGFYVADDGPGIPEGRRDDVFEHGFSTDEGGTGFGLSIVENIVEAHGGEITVGESADGGARFEIRLPAADRVTRHVAED